MASLCHWADTESKRGRERERERTVEGNLDLNLGLHTDDHGCNFFSKGLDENNFAECSISCVKNLSIDNLNPYLNLKIKIESFNL